ncbi:hypothetical protein TNIN_72391 [Trichonephila inaurata madagascariensis]|uniref:Uncharacterized protein n=1 Tax=Trichonephila inaurata madagascariensis TaxID=2747483 RepID=A0A8X6XQS8_9ARAC|nr:hypothetical protein TNIN_72391 [Trichonephila inaurata madagascariensis]
MTYVVSTPLAESPTDDHLASSSLFVIGYLFAPHYSHSSLIPVTIIEWKHCLSLNDEIDQFDSFSPSAHHFSNRDI